MAIDFEKGMRPNLYELMHGGGVFDAYTKAETDVLLDSKQDVLESGINIKTVNNHSLLGSGNIEVSGGSGGEDKLDVDGGNMAQTFDAECSQFGIYVNAEDSQDWISFSADYEVGALNYGMGIYPGSNMSFGVHYETGGESADAGLIFRNVDNVLSLSNNFPNGYLEVKDLKTPELPTDAANKDYVDNKFLLVDFSQAVTDGLVYPMMSSEPINGVSTGRVDIRVPSQYSSDYKIVSIVKYELFNSTTRIEAAMMFQFSMEQQTVMRVGFKTSGSNSLAYNRIAGAMLLARR